MSFEDKKQSKIQKRCEKLLSNCSTFLEFELMEGFIKIIFLNAKKEKCFARVKSNMFWDESADNK